MSGNYCVLKIYNFLIHMWSNLIYIFCLCQERLLSDRIHYNNSRLNILVLTAPFKVQSNQYRDDQYGAGLPPVLHQLLAPSSHHSPDQQFAGWWGCRLQISLPVVPGRTSPDN